MTSLSAASIQNNIGAIFLENGNVDEAMERFYAAIHICDTQEEVVMEEGQWPQLSLSSIDNDINDNDDNDIEIDNDCIINTISGGGNADKNGNNQSRNDPTSIIDICGVSFPSIRQDTVDKFTNVDTSGLMWFYNRKCREYLSSSSSTTTATTSTSSIAAVVSNSSSSPLHIMETTITFGLEYITVPTFSFSSSSSSSSSIKYTQEDAKCIALFNLARICANMDDLSFQENKSSSSSSSSLSSSSSIITPQSIQENNQRIQTLLTASLNELTKQQSSLNTCKTISSSFRLHGVRVQQQQHEQEQCKRNNYKLQCMIRNNLGVVQFGNHQPQEALQEFEVCLRLIQLLLSLEGGDDGNDNDGEVDPSTSSYSSSTPYSTTTHSSSSSTYSTRRNNGYPHGHSNSNYSSSTFTSSSSLSTQMMTNTTLPLSYLHMTTLFNLCRTYIRLNDCTKALQLSNEILNMDISTCNSHANATTTSSRIPLSTSPSTMEIETTQKMKWLQQTTKYYHQGLIQERQEHVTDALSNYNVCIPILTSSLFVMANPITNLQNTLIAYSTITPSYNDIHNTITTTATATKKNEIKIQSMGQSMRKSMHFNSMQQDSSSPIYVLIPRGGTIEMNNKKASTSTTTKTTDEELDAYVEQLISGIDTDNDDNDSSEKDDSTDEDDSTTFEEEMDLDTDTIEVPSLTSASDQDLNLDESLDETDDEEEIETPQMKSKTFSNNNDPISEPSPPSPPSSPSSPSSISAISLNDNETNDQEQEEIDEEQTFSKSSKSTSTTSTTTTNKKKPSKKKKRRKGVDQMNVSSLVNKEEEKMKEETPDDIPSNSNDSINQEQQPRRRPPPPPPKRTKPPNTLHRFLLKLGLPGKLLVTITLLSCEFISQFLPEVHFLLYSILNKVFKLDRGRMDDASYYAQRRRMQEEETLVMNERNIAIASGKKLSKRQTRALDQDALAKLRQLHKSNQQPGRGEGGVGDSSSAGVQGGKYTHLSLVFQKRFVLGKFREEEKFFESMIAPLEEQHDDDHELEMDGLGLDNDGVGSSASGSRRRRRRRSSSMGVDSTLASSTDMASSTTQEDNDWIIHALNQDNDLLRDTLTSSSSLITSAFTPDDLEELLYKVGNVAEEAATASLRQDRKKALILEQKETSKRKEQQQQQQQQGEFFGEDDEYDDVTVMVASTKGSGNSGGGSRMLGGLMSSSSSRYLLGAYPGDAYGIDDAGSANGILDLARKYGYGEWDSDNEYGDEDVDYDGSDTDNDNNDEDDFGLSFGLDQYDSDDDNDVFGTSKVRRDTSTHTERIDDGSDNRKRGPRRVKRRRKQRSSASPTISATTKSITTTTPSTSKEDIESYNTHHKRRRRRKKRTTGEETTPSQEEGDKNSNFEFYSDKNNRAGGVRFGTSGLNISFDIGGSTGRSTSSQRGIQRRKRVYRSTSSTTISSTAPKKKEKTTVIGTSKRTVTMSEALNRDGDSDGLSISGKTTSQPMLSPMKRTEDFWKIKRKNADDQS